MNSINISVLTKTNPKITSINIILTGLALANNVVNVDYVLYALGNLIFRDQPNETALTYEWAAYVLFHAHASQVNVLYKIQITGNINQR